MVAEGLINGQVVCREEKQYRSGRKGCAWKSTTRACRSKRTVPISSRCARQSSTTSERSGAGKRYVHFHVDGPGSIIGGEANQANPMKTQFGVATALVRAGLTPGKLHVTATCDGLKSASIDITTVAPRLPLFPAPSP